MANRYRNNGIYLMLSDDELEILNKKYKPTQIGRASCRERV